MNRRDLLKAAVAAGFLPAFPASALLRGGSAIAAPNPLGVNLAAGGNGSLYFEGMPFFKNQIRQCRGFQQVGSTTVWVPRSGGWPTTDFDCHLFSGANVPSWVVGTWSCGFIGTGLETISPIGTGVTAGSIVHGSGGAYSTFTLSVPSGATAFGFSITGTTGGVTNVFAYSPPYNTLNTIDDVTNVNSVRTEAVNHLKKFSHLRNLWLSGAPYNTQQSTSTSRNTPSNCQTNNGWTPGLTATLSAIPGSGATSVPLASGWAGSTGVYAVWFRTASGSPFSIARVVTLTNGSTSCDWTAGGGALPQAMLDTNLHYGLEAYPTEWTTTIANAANTGAWYNTPLFEDGPNGSAGSWTAAVCTDIATRYTGPGPILFEFGNENVWNGNYYGTPLLTEMWQLFGFSSIDDYYAYRLHQFATVAKANLPAGWWGTKVFPVLAYQAVAPGKFASILGGYSTYGTPKNDLGYLACAPYSNPSIASNTDTIATIEADCIANAQNVSRQSSSSFCEQIAVVGLHYGIPLATYEGGFQWNGNNPATGTSYSNVVNLGAVIMDAVGYPACVETLWGAVYNAGVVLATHFSDGVATSTGNSSPIDELTTNDTLIDSSPTMAALSTYFPPNALSITRNDVTVPGTVIDGRNYTDNVVALSSAFPTFGGTGFANPGQVPYPSGTSKGTVAYLLYSQVPRTVTLSANFTNSGGAGTTNLEYGSAPAGFTIIGGGTPTAFAIPAGTNSVSLGTFPVVAGWNYVLLGIPGTLQAGVTINSLTAG